MLRTRLRPFLFLLSLLWISQLAAGQFIYRQTPNLRLFTVWGSLDLEDGRTVEGMIAYHIGERPYLQVRSHEAEEVIYSPHQVRSFLVDGHRFVTAGDFSVKIEQIAALRLEVQLDFAELLEDGNVELLLHHGFVLYYRTDVSGISPYTTLRKNSYLLRKRGEQVPFSVLNVQGNSDKELRSILEPYFVSRPDLLQKLKDKTITYTNLPACIHAYNTGQPM